MGFNPLSLLLGQQLSGVINPGEYIGEDIIVSSPKERPVAARPDFADAPEREQIQPRYVLQDDRIAPRPEELEEIVPRQGKFGVKGTLRDVLGILGDAFLVQSGNKAVYEPQRQMERQGDAMFGASQNPMQAAERLAAMGYVDGARELLEQTQRNEYQRSSLASQEGARQDLSRDRQYTNVTQARNQVARWYQVANTPEKQAVALRLTQRLADELGVGIDQLGIDSVGLMDENERSVVAAGDMTVNQQQQIPLRERQLDISEYNSVSGRINATHPRNPPPRPRADTELEYYRAISEVPVNERTAEEKAWVRKYIEGTRGGRTSRIGNTPPPAPGTTRRNFRLVD